MKHTAKWLVDYAWPNYYVMLGVHRQSTAAEIKLAWQRIATVTHPDHTTDQRAYMRFVSANKAYHCLRNMKLTQAYLLRLKLLGVECSVCSGSGTRVRTRGGWGGVAMLTACINCKGCGYMSQERN